MRSKGQQLCQVERPCCGALARAGWGCQVRQESEALQWQQTRQIVHLSSHQWLLRGIQYLEERLQDSLKQLPPRLPG